MLLSDKITLSVVAVSGLILVAFISGTIIATFVWKQRKRTVLRNLELLISAEEDDYEEKINPQAKDIEDALMRSLTNTKASSCSDIHLSRALYQYDLKEEEPLLCLEQISKNTTFVLNGKHFVKLNKRRTRYECQETSSGKIYLVHALAKVTIIEL